MQIKLDEDKVIVPVTEHKNVIDIRISEEQAERLMLLLSKVTIRSELSDIYYGIQKLMGDASNRKYDMKIKEPDTIDIVQKP